MIGVISKPEERKVVEEFFELFKTRWEFFDARKRHYKVLLITNGNIPETEASLIIIYGAEKCALEEFEKTDTVVQSSDLFVEDNNVRLPIYGKAIKFSNPDHPILFRGESKEIIGYKIKRNGKQILRISYDLFQEILFLLTIGQPAESGLIPTLDLHIAMPRNWIVENGIPLVEIPPVPEGYRFIACLTHDVDFIGIRQHFLDHSMWGFLYRATLGSMFDVIRGKASLLKLKQNLRAVLSLPFVFLGICWDPWDQFDRCLEIEKGISSTFFFIPFKKQAGQGFCKGKAKRRAAKYDVKDASCIVQKLVAQGCEIGVHGIDAWHSVENSKKELQRLKVEINSQDRMGIRIHWLVRNERTFGILDEAGYSYDSSVGYNETVGFKAGTAQPFRPIGTNNLLEISLQIQDTALFGNRRMNTLEEHAHELCRQIIDHVRLCGGVLTVLWHQRSLGPERLWATFYAKLIKEIQAEEGWMATGSEIVDWFRMRRAAKFKIEKSGNGEERIILMPLTKETLPRLIIRRYEPKNWFCYENHSDMSKLIYEDISCSGKC